DEIKAFAKIGKPMVGVPPRQVMPLARWGELGGRVGCIPTVLQVAALHGMRQCLEELKRAAPKPPTSRTRRASRTRASGTPTWATTSGRRWKKNTATDHSWLGGRLLWRRLARIAPGAINLRLRRYLHQFDAVAVGVRDKRDALPGAADEFSFRLDVELRQMLQRLL